MKQKKSLSERWQRIRKSNGAHKMLRNKARKKDGWNSKKALYHQYVINIQNMRCDILSKSERKALFKRS